MARTTYTADEIDSAFEQPEDLDHTCSAGNYDGCVACEWDDDEHGWPTIAYSAPGDTTEIVLRGEKINVTYIDGESGGEGSGESVWAIVRVGSQYFKKTGWYASHDGTYWDGDVKEVKRKQRTVTFYE